MIRLLGVARDSSEAALMISTGAQPSGAGAREAAPPPQLYSAPDPEEDPEAQVRSLCVQRAGQLLDSVCSRFRATTSLSANSGVLNLNHVFAEGNGEPGLASSAGAERDQLRQRGPQRHPGECVPNVQPWYALYTLAKRVTFVQHTAAALAFNYCACVACAVF
jgi:hypothetical protein